MNKVLIIAADAHQAIYRAIRVLRLVSTADIRTERVRMLLTTSVYQA